MPYINEEDRKRLNHGGEPKNAGELNYVITKILNDYLKRKGGLRYEYLNEIMGVLECAKAEFYRRVASPYEEKKIAENGDVYISGL